MEWPLVGMGMDIYGNYILGGGGIVNEDINITGSVIIENHGLLNGQINICSGCAVRIINYGEINSEFVYMGNASVIQYVNGVDTMHKIPNLTGFDIEVETSDTLDMSDFMDLISSANSVSVSSGSFMINSNVADNNVTINVGNGVAFYVNNIPDDSMMPVISNISGTPFVGQINVDPMYVVTPRWSGGALYLDLARQTDYSLIMENALGDYLDELRADDSNDKLIHALDMAQTRQELNDVLSDSGRTNPIKLMDVTRSINTLYDAITIQDMMKVGFVARPFYVSSDDFSFVGASANVAGTIGENAVGTIGMVGGMLKYDGEYDDFNAALYGGNVGVQYFNSDFYLRAFGVLIYESFDDVNVFDGTKSVKNPDGFDGMLTSDIGMVFTVDQEFKLVPFVGARMDYMGILDDTDFDVNARLGLNIVMDTKIDGNKYNLGAKFFAQTDGAIYGGLYSDMMSVADGVGGGASVGLLYDDMGLSYKFELNVRFEF